VEFLDNMRDYQCLMMAMLAMTFRQMVLASSPGSALPFPYQVTHAPDGQ